MGKTRPFEKRRLLEEVDLCIINLGIPSTGQAISIYIKISIAGWIWGSQEFLRCRGVTLEDLEDNCNLSNSKRRESNRSWCYGVLHLETIVLCIC